MAIWDFRFYIFPFEGIKNFYGFMPSLLIEYNMYEDFEDDLIYNNYFSGNEKILEDVRGYLKENLKKNEYWDKEADSYTDELGNIINIYNNEIYIESDLTILNLESIDKLLHFINKYNVVIVVGRTGKIIPADIENLMDEIRKTKYYELANR